MSTEIPAAYGPFIDQLIADGVVKDRSEAVDEAFRLLEQRERLRKQVNVGLEQLARGEELTEEEVYGDLERELEELRRKREAG
ncbi:MAG: type II toxin-antitoxin system ParD family antitoxin [Pirellulales bacterium]